MAKQRDEPERAKTMMMQLKAPDEWFKAVDEWCEKQNAFIKPSRPAAIRWIVWTFLQKQQQRDVPRKRRGSK
jgi:hypothetical protein